MLKKRYLFLMIIVCFFAISAVSAEDNSTSDIVSVSNDVNSLETNCNMNSIVNESDTLKVSNDEVLTAGDTWYVNGSKTSSGDGKSEATAFKTLNEALAVVQDDNTIMIASGEYKGTDNTNLTFDKNLNFIKYGDGEAIFDAESQSRIWTVTATSINITGLTFKNGKADKGGAIYINGNVSGNLNGTFINNNASEYGGAIYIRGSVSGNLNGTFIYNTALNNRAGAIYIHKGVSGNLTGTFINNTANNWGGAMVINDGVSGNLSGIFINNTAPNNGGGAIYINGNVSGNLNGIFINNTAKYCGAIYISGGLSGNLNSTFINNTATIDYVGFGGGAIEIYGGISGNLTGTFINNSAKKGRGGAIFLSGALSGNLNATFINNTAKYGGAIFISNGVYGKLDGTFINNKATTDGGAIYIDRYRDVSGNLKGTFINNTADYRGGAIYIYASVSGKLDGTFTNNKATNNVGGAIYIENGGVSGNLNGTFINNNAHGGGGAIYINAGVSGNLNGTFINNNAEDSGGAIFIGSGGVSGNLNGTFSNNKAKKSGGAIYINAGVSGNLNGTFINNNAEDSGGAIFIGSGGVSGKLNGTFSNNKAKKSGGAIFIVSGGVSGKLNGTFSNNKARNNGGGAIFINGDISGNLNGTFINNNAHEGGGAIYINGDISGNLNGTFINNNAEDSGGAIFINGGVPGNLTSTFNNNKAGKYGGAIYTESTAVIINSNFKYNTADTDGGAIYAYGELILKNTIFENNKASGASSAQCYGGAIRGKNDVKVENCSFLNNHADDYGGAIYAKSVYITSKSFFINNTAADDDGGAIYAEDSVNIVDSIFSGNSAKVDGGAIYAKGNVDLKNTIFENNKAEGAKSSKCYGGAIRSEKDVKIDNCSFFKNHAENYGGAIYADTITWVNNLPSYFIGNYAEKNSGGAIYTNKFTTDPKYGVFINNTVKSNNDGGAIYINHENHLLISQCYFENNRCGDEGGAIYLDSTSSTLSLKYNIFVGNGAGKKGNIVYNKGKYNVIHNNWYGKNVFVFSNELVEYYFWGSDINHQDDKMVLVELSLNETGHPSILIVTFLSDEELFNYDAKFSADNGAILSNHKIGNNTVTSDIVFNEGITTVNATVNRQVLTLSYSFYKENVTMNINAPEISFGDNATVNIIFTPNNATGTVSVGNISSEIVNGASTVIIPNLSVGNHTLLVIYSGDWVYNPKEANVTITVNRKNLNINAGAKPIHKGENATVIVTDLEYATGNVTVTINNTDWTGKITNGTANIIISGLNESTTANVTYIGDANYTNASTTVTIVVNPRPKENLTISASADPIMIGEDATVIVNGLENATGNVTVIIGSNEWYGEIIDGTAGVIVTGLTENVTATVFYAGDYKYNNATTTVNIRVNPAVTVWYVNGSKASSGNGTTPDNAFKTLKEALNKAPENSTIYIAQGTYTGENNINLTVNKNLNFINYGAGEVIFDAEGLSRIWTVNAGRINITGLTFKNGKEQSVCGAIFFNQTINNSYINAIFINNTVVEGLAGAIGFYADVINTNINSIFIENTVNAGYGGAIFFNGNLSNVNITGNYTANTANDYGGAIVFYGNLSNVNILGNFTSNTANDSGGAIFFNGKLTDVNISGSYNNNWANDTAGVFLFNSNLTNVIISGDYTNNAAQYCAAYYMSEFATINNSSISGNYYNNSADYCVVFLMEGIISNSNISGNYTNNKAKMGINVIGEAYNVNMSGNYVNNNVSDGSVIYIGYCDENSIIHDSIFINNTIDDELIIDVMSGSFLSVNNWFGNNATNYNIKPKVGENVTMINWLFLNATANATELKINETAEITFKLYSYKDGEIKEYDASKMNIILDLSQIHGTLNQTDALINEIILYKYTEEGFASVTGKFKTASFTIFLVKKSTDIIINKTDLTLNVTESVFSGATLKPSEAGNLTYTSSNTTVAVVENGMIKGLKEGTATITVSFSGNDEYAPAKNKTINVTVKLIDASVSVDTDTLNLTVNETFDIIAITDPAGLNVTYSSNNESVATVDANGKVTAKSAGTAIITASVGGDGVYALNSTNVTVTVSKVPTDITVSNTTVTLKVNDNISSGATLTPPEAGNLTYTSSNPTVAVVENGIIKGLKEGTAIITVSFSGNEEYAPAENKTITVTVKLRDASVSVNNDTLNLTVSDTFDIVATTVPLGLNVTYTTSDASVAAVDADGKVTAKSAGTAIITVSVGGDGVYALNSTNVSVTVKPIPPKENLTLNATAEPIDVGEDANVIVTGLKDATGEVIVVIGSDVWTGEINKGIANVVVTGLKETTTASVIYAGDEKYNLASTIVKITVNPEPKENLTISASAEPIAVGDNATVVVTGLKDATGEVIVAIGSDVWTGEINNGIANVVVTGLKETAVASVIYAGDEKYNLASTTVKITVNQNVIIDAPDVTKYYGGSERFVVMLKDSSGNPIANADIKITINGQTYTKTTDSNGETSIGINLNSGVYNVTTEYNGTKVYSTVTVKDTVIAKDVTKIFRNGTQYQGTFVDSKGNLVKNTDVRININGVFYTRTTDANGMAQMNINLPPGTYILTATNPVTGEQHTTTVTVLPNIVENYDLTKYYKNASQYSLRLLDDKGNPVGAGVSIQLNINGVFYNGTSDENGYVKMNINLPPGIYIVTAEYKGLKVSNTINVLTVLETEDLVMKYHDGSQFKAKVLDGQGRPYAGQTVTYNINGVFYTKISGDDGIAGLTINLPAGEYIITSMYNGLNAANKVTIIG